MPKMVLNGKITWNPVALRPQVLARKVDAGVIEPALVKTERGDFPHYTVSNIKADVGSAPGHVIVHPKVMDKAEEKMTNAIEHPVTVMVGDKEMEAQLIDAVVYRVGDDAHLLMTHLEGENSPLIHGLAYQTFLEMTKVAKELKIYGAGQDILKPDEVFSGNVKGMGPGVAEMDIYERKSEPLVAYAADKTSPFAWNPATYKMFADASNTIGLVVDDKMSPYFDFQVKELKHDENAIFHSPEENVGLLAHIVSPAYAVEKVWKRSNDPDVTEQERIAASTSTSRLSFIAGKYVGKDDPVMLVRTQSGLPAVGETVNAFAIPYLVPGGMRGSCWRPLMPNSIFDNNPTFNDGPPRVIGLGFQMKDGTFIGPVDILGDQSLDGTRASALEIARYMQRISPFQPGLLADEDLEYGGIPKLREAFADRFQPVAATEGE